MQTWAPSLDSIEAMPFPSPVPPPVMKATFPSNVPFGSIVSDLAGNALLESQPNLTLTEILLVCEVQHCK